MQKTTLRVFIEKGDFFHEGGAIAPSALPQLHHWIEGYNNCNDTELRSLNYATGPKGWQ